MSAFCLLAGPLLHAAIDPQVKQRIEALASEDGVTRERAADWLLARGPEAIPELLETAASSNLVLSVPTRELLQKFGPDAIDRLILAGNRDFTGDRRQWSTAEDLVTRMGGAALPRILEIFKHADPVGSDWAFASAVLYKLRGLAVEPLVPLIEHPNEKVRQMAASLLASIGDPRSYDALVRGLASGDALVRMYCARGLGNLGDPTAVPLLLSTLKDPDWRAQRDAAAALGKMWEPRFLEPIGGLARAHPEILVRDTAANVLIYSSQDRAAERVGRRYKPVALSPGRRAGIEIGYLLRLGVSALTLLVVSIVTLVWAPRAAGMAGWLLVALAVSAALGLGWFWGYLVEHIEGYVEYLLLALFMPAALFLSFVVGVLARPTGRQAIARAAWIGVLLGVYTGYGLGWLRLWGYLRS